MARKTALFAEHVAAGARMVDFGGWEMPLHYGSQIEEHHAVRRAAGVFDVSHMTVVDVAGPQALTWLQTLLANDAGRLESPGRGLYSCMLNPQGGVIDDLIVYRLSADGYRLIVNAATRDKDLAWMQAQAPARDFRLTERGEKIMLAVQGPAARQTAAACLPPALAQAALALPRFGCVADGPWFVARTGYTGEDGWEIVCVELAAGKALWRELLAAGLKPCGLGARDTLRLEAGLALYGQDLDEEHSPLSSGLGWTVAWEPASRRFIGRDALLAERQRGPAEQLAGLLLLERGIMRHGQPVRTPAGGGVVTSGGFSPTLQQSIALARLPAGASGDCEVEIRGRRRRGRIVEPVFVRHGQPVAALRGQD